MKKMIYVKPTTEVISLDIRDVIATSGEDTGGDEPP